MPPLSCVPDVAVQSGEPSLSRLDASQTVDWINRAKSLLSHEISFVMNDSFRSLSESEARDEWEETVEVLPDRSSALRSQKSTALNAHYQRMCETPLLSPELERACFKRFNWLKFRANAYRAQLDLEHLSPEHVMMIEDMLKEAVEVRNYIMQANCRLAMSIVKNFSESQNEFDELLSEGLTNLMGAIEKFDYSRGFRFSTYATQSINRRLFRVSSQRHKQRKRYLNNSDDALTATLGVEENSTPVLGQEELLQLHALLLNLEQRERLIIEARFGLHTSGRKQTFVEIGKRLKISKERVRQLAERALHKLRLSAEQLNFEPI